jgi:hypothetical protein
MARPSEAHVEAAKRMLSRESASGGNAELRAAAPGRVYETLFESLAPIIGEAGVRALFARSVRLTKAEFPCLGELLLTAEPPESSAQVAAQLVRCLSKLEPAAASAAATGLYAMLLGLMSNFIGDRLVWKLVRIALPETSPKETE